ncbi:glutathione peroxidase [Leptothrix discophora]|uniref:Glutathione peroxidase n=1 Tax=Leptothrix discophora TaxID=89 RepID=A0ABT9FZP7_LEPDI|nr:glutathione peroxidase [Leptothrix discophora]MDP4299701.1 glutathione peroxidase [Leptothrix discophora]
MPAPLFALPAPSVALRPALAVLLSVTALAAVHPTAWAQAAAKPPAATNASCPALLNHTFARLQDEKDQSLCQYAGKVLLVVNTASFCGYTGQYEGLEALHARYKDKGLVVLGFPSNDFNQEGGDNKQIAEFCANTFNVKFPMFAKSSVKGAQASPFYRQLADRTGQAPRWNFHKYLIGRDGQVIDQYVSNVGPDDRKLVAAIEKQLAAR